MAAEVDEREDESNCPPSTPVSESMSARAAAYQKQITGLDLGSAVVLNNDKFDGCRQSDGTMLEAKGPGYAQFIVASADAVQSWYQGGTSILEWTERQAETALAARILEWHFAEKLASEYYARKFRASPYARTMYDPPL
ncbi:Tox-REase-5 domain-containing protein [Bradyrhizobium sp. USDA 4451]